MSESFEDFYVLLGVTQSAPVEEIRRAFRERMREWHPDINPSAEASSMTQRLIVAYKILNDAEARSRYDFEYSKRIPERARQTADKHPDPKPYASEPESFSNQAEPRRHTSNRSPRSTVYEDPDLDRWVRTARREAAEEWRKLAADFKDASKAVGAGAVQGLKTALVLGGIAFIILSIFAAIAGSR
jgi:DnaJ-class molecular chaperone